MKEEDVKPGMEVIVTGDDGDSGHEFEAGTEGVISDPLDWDEGHEVVRVINGAFDYWWVNLQDLAPKFPAVDVTDLDAVERFLQT